jgi:hypothetical protein
MHDVILTGDKLRAFAEDAIDLGIKYGTFDACDRDAEIEKFLERYDAYIRSQARLVDT